MAEPKPPKVEYCQGCGQITFKILIRKIGKRKLCPRCVQFARPVIIHF